MNNLSPATVNYWCTWCTQSACLPAAKVALAPLFAGDQARPGVRDAINEEAIFGQGGWADFFPESRSDLFFLLDDGWDVPYGAGQGRGRIYSPFGSMSPDPVRFPTLRGTPGEKLAELRRRLQSRGWRGLGLWVAIRSQAEDGQPGWEGMTRRDEWRRKLEWCAEGGVSYLKVDWGDGCGDLSFRRMLTELKNEIAPQIIIEHCRCQLPVNGMNKDKTGGGRRLFGPEDEELRAWELEALKATDTWRIYDWMEPLVMPQAVDRVVTDISLAEKAGANVVVSAEDALYVAAALGCAFGIMRSPVQTPDAGKWPSFPSKRLREVDRAVSWERIAPAFAPSPGFGIAYSDEALYDSWRFEKGEFWDASLCGFDISQGAPARVSRGMALPEVEADGEKPYVLCSLNPSGAISVAVQPRIENGRHVTPPADVTLDAELKPGVPLGCFGTFRKLTVKAEPGQRYFARDIAGGNVRDITGAVRFAGGFATFPGDLLAGIGKETDNDDSMPGTMVTCNVQ